MEDGNNSLSKTRNNFLGLYFLLGKKINGELTKPHSTNIIHLVNLDFIYGLINNDYFTSPLLLTCGNPSFDLQSGHINNCVVLVPF